MIVACTNGRQNHEVGRRFVVIEVHASPRGVSYRLFDPLDDDGTPPLGDASNFEIVSGRIAPTWEAQVEGASLTLAPRAWLRESFWEDYFADPPPWVVSEYRDALAELLRFESLPDRSGS